MTAWRFPLVVSVLATLALVPSALYAQDIQADSVLTAPRIAPGEGMPIRVRLANFGAQSRADMVIVYRITDENGRVITSETETVAVETTASFIRDVAIPALTPAGTYTAQVVITYPGQRSPAESAYQFQVEKKVFGIFITDLYKYLAVAVFASVTALAAVRHVHRLHGAAEPHDYSDVPDDVRMYYEIISEIIHEMRLHEGSKALSLVQKVPGLTVSEAGRVSALEGNPADIVATLVQEYEKRFGKHANFAFGRHTKKRFLA